MRSYRIVGVFGHADLIGAGRRREPDAQQRATGRGPDAWTRALFMNSPD